MSEPVTNVEIEDVLSSIRRLVSEVDRAPRGAQRAVPERLVLSPALRVPDADEPPVNVSGKGRERQAPMVLSEPSVAPVAHTPPAAEAASPVAGADPCTTLVLGAEDSAEDAATVMADTADTRPEGAEPLATVSDDLHRDADLSKSDIASIDAAVVANDPQDDPQDGVVRHDGITEITKETTKETTEDAAEAGQIAALRASLTEILVPDQVAGIDDSLDTADDPDVQADLSATDLAVDVDIAPDTELDRKIAALELMLERQSKDWTPTPSASDPIGDPLETPQPGVDSLADPDVDAPEAVDGPDSAPPLAEGGDAALQAAVAAVAEAAMVAEDDPDTGTDAPDHLSSDMMTEVPDDALAGAEALSPETPSPEAGSPDEPANDASAVPGNARPAFVRHAPTEALDWEDHAPGATPQSDPVQEVQPEQAAVTELSEEALQAVVSEIVRQELQGALGERITRNVRKLVRREIHRVLMSKDLD
ncbi:hypothetical protein [Antarctobacter heliothermus]|uniref:Uncharacterized protein n=1 Tax=Antarctobacter heliothermus TaxID=74033 RepID=A0A239LGZ5_9RHOB|nr:hypothetical protein [Antarctobacter heliothermus]SNT29192.1 hypothetical protein SAMN04488078_108912 [Antarctobacter heliothermus]